MWMLQQDGVMVESKVWRSPFNMSIVHVVAARGDVEVLRGVVVRGDVVELSRRNDLHQTLLHLTVNHDHVEVVKVILGELEEGHVDMNAVAMFGVIPLHLSVMRRLLSVAEVLFSASLVDKMA